MKILKVFGIAWGSLVILTMFLSILGIFVTAPTFYQGWLKFAHIFSPFDLWNYVVAVMLLSIVLSPAIGAFALYERLRKQFDIIQHYPGTPGFKEKKASLSDTLSKITTLCAAHGRELMKGKATGQIITYAVARNPVERGIYPEHKEEGTPSSGQTAKMKLKASYTKDARGFITASIKVVDPGDFPTAKVFKPASEDTSDEAWSLGEGEEFTTSKTLPTSDEAQQWVLSQVKALKRELDQWRAIVVPDSEEFEF